MIKLAINGGKPIRTKPLPYGKQFIDEEDCIAVNKVMKSDFLTTGPLAKEFEEIVAKHVNAKYAVAYSSGTAALHASCYTLGIKTGDEVITSPITFAASANCVLYVGGKPIFADINPETFLIDPVDIEKRITKKTTAIIPVDFTGQVVDMDRIKNAIDGTNIKIIEDAAHSIGTKYKNQPVGSITDLTIFSFHPVKTITTGEGGMVTTNNIEYYKKLVNFRTHCITRDRDQMTNPSEDRWYYEQIDLGFNYRITDFQCALGLSQMKKLNWFAQRRKEIVSKYIDAFKNMDTLVLQKNENYSDTVNHLFVLKLNLSKLRVSRKEIFNALNAENIGVFVHYVPVYWHPYYQKLGYIKGLCPKAEELYECILTVPLFPAMADDDVNDVINGFNKVLTYYKA